MEQDTTTHAALALVAIELRPNSGLFRILLRPCAKDRQAERHTKLAELTGLCALQRVPADRPRVSEDESTELPTHWQF